MGEAAYGSSYSYLLRTIAIDEQILSAGWHIFR
jgi:hypothetical protein